MSQAQVKVLLLLYFFSSAHGITSNCTSKNSPSLSCCSGEITLDPTMTTISSSAFSGCSNLTGSLTIPPTVTSIGGHAFQGCSGFSGSLTIPPSVTSIGNVAFQGCSGFSGSLTIPSSVTSIGNVAFQGCSGFSGSLTIPPVTSIAASAFEGCSGLNGSLTIPPSVTSIGDYAFKLCSGFSGSLTIPPTVTSIGRSTFRGCSSFSGSLTIPPSVTSIGNGAFDGCSGFTSAVTFPNSVATLGSGAFANNLCDWISCCDSCELTGAEMCACDNLCSGICAPTGQPTGQPTATGQPTSHPTTPGPTLFSFGVKIGHEGILSSGKGIVVDYLQDTRRGESDPSHPFLLHSSLTLPVCFFLSGKMTPISYIANSSRVSSDSDPPLSSDSILIKWRPVSSLSGIGSWESSHLILNIPGGVFVSWLVSLSSEAIMGFIVQGQCIFHSSSLRLSFFPSPSASFLLVSRPHLFHLSHLFYPILPPIFSFFSKTILSFSQWSLSVQL
jgi:hypothetical protein